MSQEFLSKLPPDILRLVDEATLVREPELKWYLVFAPGEELPECFEHETLAGLVIQLRELLQEDCHYYVFYGQRGFLSREQPRYLIPPTGSPVPLFELPASITAQESGYTGIEQQDLAEVVESTAGDAEMPEAW